jgi:periplasmic divalent cation tolerance protein
MAQCLVYMTAGSEEEALRIGSALVEENLAACVNILGAIRSLYRWKGAVQNDSEVAFLAKTEDDRFLALRDRVGDLHSYETPCIVALSIADGEPAFLSWITEMTRPE